MDTVQNSQSSSTDRRLTLLEQEINAILGAAGITADDNIRNQLLSSLGNLYGPQGLTGQFSTQQLTQATGSTLLGAEIGVYNGSPAAPGTVLMSNAPRGEYRTSNFFADSPLGANQATFGLLRTGGTFKDTPEAQSLQTWMYQEWISFSNTTLTRPMRYLRSNVNNGGWSGWAAQEAIDTTNMFNYSGIDLPLAVGQSFSYDTANTAVTQVPLRIATGPGQLYEISVVQRNPTVNSAAGAYPQTDLDLLLLPNNTSYPQAFSVGSITTQSQYVQGGNLNPNYSNWTIYTDNVTDYSTLTAASPASTSGTVTPPPYANSLMSYVQSASGFPGVTNYGFSGFWFDDIGGYANPPYFRKISVFTGDANTAPVAFHVGGGGSFGFNTGVNTAVSVWQNFSQVGYYQSLGLLSTAFSNPGGQVKCAFLVNVKRLA